MDHSRLLNSAPRDLSLYLRHAASSLSPQRVTETLLTHITAESLPPRVFSIWLTSIHDPSVVRDGLGQEISRLVRRRSIIAFAKALRRPEPERLWEAVGGTPGILDFLARASVSDVRLFCSHVGLTGARGAHLERKQQLVDSLALALQQQPLPSDRWHSTDRRPLGLYYHDLLPACSSRTRRQISGQEDLPISVRRDRFIRELQVGGPTQTHPYQWTELLDYRGSVLIPATTGRMSSNMQFSVHLLDALSRIESLPEAMSHNSVHDRVILPLFRKIARKKANFHQVVAAIRSLSGYHLKHGQSGLPLFTPSHNGVVHYTIGRWARHPDELEDSLRRVLELVADSDATRASYEVMTLIIRVPWHLRLRLLALLLRHISMFSTKIESNEELESSRFRWPPDLFLALPRQEGLKLLERVIATKPPDYWTHWGPRERSGLRRQHRGDPTCLVLLLSKNQQASFTRAREIVSHRQSLAEKARLQPDRAFWAQNVLDCSTASGSIDLYRDALLWMRRFGKDPLTMKELCSSRSLHTSEGIDLLRGFPRERNHDFPTLGAVQSSIQVADLVLRELVDLACEALKEPSFHPDHFRPIWTLVNQVVSSRVAHIPLLQSKLHLTNEQLFQAAFRDTLETLIQLEKVASLEDFARLGFRSLYGPLTHVSTNHEVAILFIDELARRRDGFWHVYRQRHRPATISIGKAYPTGLPLQFQVPVSLNTTLPHLQSSFVRSRAEKIVFIDPSVALESIPMDEETRESVGVFVDDWTFALKALVSLSANAQVTAIMAWKHAIGPLSQGRMSENEAFLFWCSIFRNNLQYYQVHGPWEEDYVARLPNPRLPSSGKGTNEWYPNAEASQYSLKSRRFASCNLDAMLEAAKWKSSDSDAKWNDVEPSIPSFNPPSLWSRVPVPWGIEPPAQEALICAALAYLGEKATSTSGIFSQPFPVKMADSSRFPSFYLDEDFIKQHPRQEYEALGVLRKCVDNVPPSILLHIVSLAFRQASKEGPAAITFELLKLLVESDRPCLSLDWLEHLVLDRPSDSSWQRKLFSQSTLKALPAQVSRDFVQNLSEGIAKRLGNAKTAIANKDGAQNKPIVKITTVKMLAQLLAGAEFIDEVTTAEVLVGLLHASAHYDIRVAVVQALLQLLRTTAASDIRESVLVALERHAVPVMGDLNEKRPISDHEWVECEAESSIPNPDLDPDHLPAMLSAVLSVASSPGVQDDLRRSIVIRVLLPTLETSIQQNARWMQCFFRLVQLDPLPMPTCPVHPALLSELLKIVEYMPRRVLSLFLELDKFCQLASERWQTLHQKIEANRWHNLHQVEFEPSSVSELTLGQPNASELSSDQVHEQKQIIGARKAEMRTVVRNYWMSFWKAAASSWQRVRPQRLLQQELLPKVEDSITYEAIQDAWLQHCDVVLRKPNITLEQQNNLLSELAPPLHVMLGKAAEAMGKWTQYVRPLVQSLVQRVEAIQTPAWQQNPQRVPNMVPSIIAPRRWLLLFPETEPASHIDHLVSSIIILLNDMVASRRPYATKYRSLVDQILQTPAEAFDRVAIAMKLGQIGQSDGQAELPTVDYLRVEFARELIEKASSSWYEKKDEVQILLRTWMDHADEDVRMAGLQCGKRLKM